jgi:hypothetical protein
MITHPPAFSDLPVWRKIAILLLIAASFFFGLAGADRNLDYYGEAPYHPVYSTGHILRTYVLGHVRYLTLEEKENAFFQLSNSWAGLGMLTAFFLFVTSPKKPSLGQDRVKPFQSLR